jgi:D-tyrosyl-tRNA(Tyr) deacylase
MRALIVRVNKAEVYVGQELCASIAKGIALFAGIEQGDDDTVLEEMAEKICTLRIFEEEKGKLNYSVKEKNYSILGIPNFTLCANTKKGRRPSFENALPKEAAYKLFENFLTLLAAREITVKKAVFGEHMDINLACDGPVNIIIDIAKRQALAT